MLMIFFVYGLAFIILGATVFLIPKRRDYLGLEDHLWLVGLFAFLHGFNEWVELFVLRGSPFNVEVLRFIGTLLLPLSFIFLVIFGSRVISRQMPVFRWLDLSWILIAVLWIFLVIKNKNFILSGIFARYFICVPGTLLTAAGLYITLKKFKKNNIPLSVLISTLIAVYAFILYGVLSGFIISKAIFFPAIFLNYENLISTLGLPVQFFRMLCALLLAASFIGISGLFIAPGKEIKGNIKRKLTIIICSCILTFAILGITLAYIFGCELFYNIIGKQYAQISRLLGTYINTEIASEVEDSMVYTTRLLWIDAVKESNSRYGGMDKKAIERQLLEMDKVWIPAGKDSHLLKEYLENKISLGMRDIVRVRSNISELFITDRYGGLVASSGKTSDFYQADKTWWQEAYNNGKGKIYVGDLEFDESSASWVIFIAVPIKDSNGDLIGICKNSINLPKILSTLGIFKIGVSGHAILTDTKGNIIFHHSIIPLKSKFCSAEEMRKLLLKKNKFFAARNPVFHEKSAFVAYSMVSPPYLSEKGVNWVMFIVQDLNETLEPLYRFISILTLVALFLIVMAIPIGSFFGGFISKPIHELHIATERVLEGDWNYKIKAKTGDEIEQFANTFREMISNIKDKQGKLENFSKGLETKVRERTKELTETQEATLNILEDLQDAKENLERSNRELLQLDKLKSDFVSTVSHELRTPLSIIKEGISLVLDKIPGDINEKQHKILDISKFNIDRLARIIDSLLDISKIEAGRVELRKGLFNISDVITQVTTSFETKIKEKGLELKLDIDKDVGSVYADLDRITQVLINLMGNAVKFTQTGYIKVSCKDKKELVVCSVIDTGIGISKNDLPKIFDKFQQFGRLAGAGEKGTGLGLSIAKNIIDMHNGSISVESEFGKGSKFTFTLHKYTPQSLFNEFVDKAIKDAAKDKRKMSIVAVSLKAKDGVESEIWRKNFHIMAADCARVIKNTLRRQGDDVVSNDGEIIIILADCTKENSTLVQKRLEQILNKCLEDKKMRDKLNMQYGCATFPDDAATDMELINKARSALAVYGKA